MKRNIALIAIVIVVVAGFAGRKVVGGDPQPIQMPLLTFALDPEDPQGLPLYGVSGPGFVNVHELGRLEWNEDEQRYERWTGAVLTTMTVYDDGTCVVTVGIPPAPPASVQAFGWRGL